MRIRQLVADEATVVIWKSAFGPMILDHPGHAAMLFRSDLLPTIEATRAAERNHIEESLVRFTKMIDKLRERHRDDIEELARAIRFRDDKFMPKALRDKSANEVEEMQREFAPWLRELEQLEQQREARRAVLEECFKDPDYILWQYMDPSDVEQYAYVSWWPGNEGDSAQHAGKKGYGRTGYLAKTDYRSDLTAEMGFETASQLTSGRYTPRQGQVRVDMRDQSGSYSWGQEPDFVISVPAFGRGNKYFGVSVRHGWSWFDTFRQNPDSLYSFMSKRHNCSGVVVEALKMSGSEAFLKAPKVALAMTPSDVVDYAKALRAAICQLNDAALRLDRAHYPKWLEKQRRSVPITTRFQLGAHRRKVGGQAPIEDELWTVQAWKAASHVGGRVRGGISNEVEGALGKYHALRWETDFCGKYKQLVKVATACTKSVDQYGIDHRNGAYLQLGMQCLKVMRSGAVRGIGQA